MSWVSRWLGIAEALARELPISSLVIGGDSMDVYLDTGKSILHWVRLTWDVDCVSAVAEPGVRVLKSWDDVTALWREYSKLMEIVGSLVRVCKPTGGAEARNGEGGEGR